MRGAEYDGTDRSDPQIRGLGVRKATSPEAEVGSKINGDQLSHKKRFCDSDEEGFRANGSQIEVLWTHDEIRISLSRDAGDKLAGSRNPGYRVWSLFGFILCSEMVHIELRRVRS
ncbi:hypothetical protein RJZ56_001598 [Blastomyces dermatitidis]|uniref:Uncharacterized protein n=1 Tax=Ajellomyces dermatitidis (strain ATCC 18188 / CBS 674.68) TaxID=653446 RepID=A0A0J9ENK3_AJEDA|nr:hypothetical protein BDDG_12220 [Blastomyces dermatitidis ATCC 18188]